MVTPESSNAIVVTFVRALSELGVPFMLVGSFSSNAYGIPRSTKDADFVIRTDQDIVGRLGALVGSEFRIEPQMRFETVTSTFKHVAEHPGSAFKVELFYLSDDPHDRERFSRRRKGVLGSVDVWLPSPEDVVVTKLRWSKGGNRAKDVEDVRDVLEVQGSGLDLDYVRGWCDRHGTRDLLEGLLTKLSSPR